jgi:hypothetical protein
MPRVDRELSGTSTQRVSQHEILRATARDDVGRTEPPQAISPDMNWNDQEASSAPLSVKLGDVMKLRQL